MKSILLSCGWVGKHLGYGWVWPWSIGRTLQRGAEAGPERSEKPACIPARTFRGLGRVARDPGGRVVAQEGRERGENARPGPGNLLWPNLGARAAVNNLHQALHVARRTLEPEATTYRYLPMRGEQLTLCPGRGAWRCDYGPGCGTGRSVQTREDQLHRPPLDPGRDD